MMIINILSVIFAIHLYKDGWFNPYNKYSNIKVGTALMIGIYQFFNLMLTITYYAHNG
jgi:hypothetical protein